MDWFKEWFNTPYYHILYKHRDQSEASGFIDGLIGQLQMKQGAKVLDLACGKGRHSIYLNQKGFDVIGADLSEKNIQIAKGYENDHLKFAVHDMREPILHHRFDYIFNLFTSFGYFDSDEEDLRTLQSIYRGLNPGGVFVLDFLNAHKVIENLSSNEEKEVEGIVFNISRRQENGYIVKNIGFQDKGKDYHFTEKVKAILPDQFETYFDQIGFGIREKLGGYNMNEFKTGESDRLIYILDKA